VLIRLLAKLGEIQRCKVWLKRFFPHFSARFATLRSFSLLCFFNFSKQPDKHGLFHEFYTLTQQVGSKLAN
jgi:hypothetical protein